MIETVICFMGNHEVTIAKEGEQPQRRILECARGFACDECIQRAHDIITKDKAQDEKIMCGATMCTRSKWCLRHPDSGKKPTPTTEFKYFYIVGRRCQHQITLAGDL